MNAYTARSKGAYLAVSEKSAFRGIRPVTDQSARMSRRNYRKIG